MPMSDTFKKRLFPKVEKIADHFGTPFHIYDEAGIRETGRALVSALAGAPGFREFFAVKALPNPKIMEIMKSMGFGFDCSSIPELVLSRKLGAGPDDIMFTSNNTSAEEFAAALAEGGCILNLDDISLIDKVPKIPDLICFRYNPGERRTGNAIIGNPVEAKYGLTHDQMVAAYQAVYDRGVRRFGLHAMIASNERNYTYMVTTAEMLLDLAGEISRAVPVRFEFINIGGGLGIPYRPEDKPLDIKAMGENIAAAFFRFSQNNGYAPNLFIESGRYMTGPHGALVTRVINHKDIYRKYVGVDASMSALMRPGIYGAHHEISVPGREGGNLERVDVVGALCENIDKFAVQRLIPETREGDLMVIHDTGAHGIAMGFNYNGRLRPKELLLREDGAVELIRRQETMDDYFATLKFEKKVLSD
ncbi:MAG: diaminopimelate decarboxylase [Thermodesulfobacteriota bacterium]